MQSSGRPCARDAGQPQGTSPQRNGPPQRWCNGDVANCHGTVTKLPGTEFINWPIQHVAPVGFKCICHYGLLATSAEARRLATARALPAMPPANPSAAEAVRKFMQREAGLNTMCCPHCTIGRRLTIGFQAPLRSRYNGSSTDDSSQAPRPAEDRRERREPHKSINCQTGKTGRTGKGPSRKGEQRPRRQAAHRIATKAEYPPRPASDRKRGGRHCSRHSRQPDQSGLSSAPQPQPQPHPARCQRTALTLHSSCHDRHGGSVQPGLPDAANNSPMGEVRWLVR